MEAAGQPPRPEEISSRITQLAMQVMAGINHLQTVAEDNVMSAAPDVPQEREVNCPICFEQFEEAHAPRTLRCGHTVCTPCLETILTRPAGDRNCPECRRPLKVTAVAHIPVSYTIMRLARALEQTCAVAAAAEAEIEEVNEAGVIGETCVRHHYPVLWWCSSCHAFQCRSCTHSDDCPERLPAGEAIVHLKQAQVEESERTVLALQDLHNTMETQQDKLKVAIDRMAEEVRQLKAKAKKVQEQVLDVEEAEAQVVEASSACRMTRALARAAEVQAAARVWLEHKNSRPSSPPLSLDDGPVSLDVLRQKLLVTKNIYAVKRNKDNEQIFAPVSVQGDKIFVHTYTTKAPPSNANLMSGNTVAFSQVTQRQVFFDIHMDGRFEGRVVIVLFRTANFKKGEVFLDLFSNAQGTTYKGLKLSTPMYRSGDTNNRVVQVGKEITENNYLPRYMPLPEHDNYNHRNIYPGLVSGISANIKPNDDEGIFPTMSSFMVHLYHVYNSNDPAGFGKVLSGLSVLRYAVWDKREAVIGDCGYVLPIAEDF
ncbi:E3 ubiquitin-protein ligase TRIM32 [Chionoecetes opilio]|uniref:E3 ubiquitin-protein ligase TRIM32 n=1 Tax=Chionoecetes opilio TaxID=41210 RepID=A0A8J4YF79_CHIOP|nr:E3 ubiquitin-protein ligase TRIM32 [Chionoecetes opilio]